MLCFKVAIQQTKREGLPLLNSKPRNQKAYLIYSSKSNQHFTTSSSLSLLYPRFSSNTILFSFHPQTKQTTVCLIFFFVRQKHATCNISVLFRLKGEHGVVLSFLLFRLKYLCGEIDIVVTVNLGKSGEYLFEGIFDCIHEITSALALSRMSESAYRVETTSRLAQWRIDNLASCTYRKSDPFKIGKWNWHLSVEKNRVLYVKLYPEISNLTRDHPPIASFVIRVVCSAGDRKALTHPEITDKQLKNNDDFIWPIEVPLTGKFIIDVEFLDLKTATPNGGEPCSIWAEGLTTKQSSETALACFGRMLTEGINTDIIINVSDGSIGAHRAVLASRSPVFRSMFSHNLQEKELSTINISDMSIQVCGVFLRYIYGNIEHEEFRTHRLALLRAADKYDILDLKEACHESLMEDIDAKNVLERLQNANLYELAELKSSCLRYLVKFGKIYDIRDDFNAFIQFADRELIADIFHEVLNTWKGF